MVSWCSPEETNKTVNKNRTAGNTEALQRKERGVFPKRIISMFKKSSGGQKTVGSES